jgi:hypothetical protein
MVDYFAVRVVPEPVKSSPSVTSELKNRGALPGRGVKINSHAEFLNLLEDGPN